MKLQDKTGVSRQYKIALENPTIATVATLQEAWIRFVDQSIKALEASTTKRQAEADAHKVNTIICECGNEFYSFDDYDFHLTLEETTEKVFAEAAAQKGDGA